MKKTLLTVLAALFIGVGISQAQVTITNITSLEGATNWAVIPYAAYDTGTKKFGAGAAVLYSVTENFWAGLRAQSLNGQSVTAGVQGQLQATVTWNGIKLTPFVEASTGMGNSSLYASGGTGALVSFGQWNLGKRVHLEVGVIGDYEHYVYGSKNGNQINAGPLVHLSF